MFTESFAQSMQQGEQNPLLQQKLATASDTEQVTKAEGLDSMTGELEDQELEAVSGGVSGTVGLAPIIALEFWRQRSQGGFVGKSLG